MDRIKELRQQQEQLQARRIEIETQISDKKVELVDLNTLTEYVTEMHKILKNSSSTEILVITSGMAQIIAVAAVVATVLWHLTMVKTNHSVSFPEMESKADKALTQ